MVWVSHLCSKLISGAHMAMCFLLFGFFNIMNNSESQPGHWATERSFHALLCVKCCLHFSLSVGSGWKIPVIGSSGEKSLKTMNIFCKAFVRHLCKPSHLLAPIVIRSYYRPSPPSSKFPPCMCTLSRWLHLPLGRPSAGSHFNPPTSCLLFSFIFTLPL